MPSLEDRFRIPGGSLDLDWDDEHENGTAQVNLPSQEPPTQIQSIAHLTPADLSRVLSCTSHPLAARTAEYVLALNISGNAFRNLDLSALNILANHDSTMATHLARIQSGVLPYILPLPPAPPIERRASQHNGSASFSSEDDSSLPGPSVPPTATTSTSSVPTNLITHDLPATHSSSSPTSPLAPPPAPPAAETPPSPSLGEGEPGNDVKGAPLAGDDPPHTAVGADGTSSDTCRNTEDIDDPSSKATSLQSSSHSDNGGQGETQSCVEDTKTQERPAHGPTEQATTAGEEQVPDMSHSRHSAPQPSPADRTPPHGRGTTSPTSLPDPPAGETAPVLPSAASTEMHAPEHLATSTTTPSHSSPSRTVDDDVATADAATVTAGGSSSEAHPPSGAYSVTAEGIEASIPEAGDAVDAQGNIMSVGSDGEAGDSAPGGPEASIAGVDDAQANVVSAGPDGEPSEAGVPPGGPEATNGQGVDVDGAKENDNTTGLDREAASKGTAIDPGAPSAQATLIEEASKAVASVTTGSSSETLSPSHGRIDVTGGLQDSAGSVSLNENGGGILPSSTADDDSTDSTPSTELPQSPSTIAPAPFAFSRADPDSPESSTSTTSSILETPSAPSNTSQPEHVDNGSLLDTDLLQFSPFSFGAELAHDERISLSGELFKDNAYLSADTSLKSLMAGSCEAFSGPGESDSAHLRPLNAQDLNLLTHGFNPAALSFTPGSHSTPVMGGEGATLALHENSYRGDEDGSPASRANDSSFTPELGHNQPNQCVGSHSDSYFCPRLGTAVDFLCSHTEIFHGVEDGASACVPPLNTNSPPGPTPLAGDGPEAALCADIDPSGSPGRRAQLAVGPVASHICIDDKNSIDRDSIKYVGVTDRPKTSGSPSAELRPTLLGLSIPIAPTSLGEELSHLSPLFSPIGGDDGQSSSETPGRFAVERPFSERSFSVSRTPKTPAVKLKRRTRMQHVAHHSCGTDTSDADFASGEIKRVFVDASVQTDEDVEEESLRRRVKALERELRSLRAALRRAEDRARESKPRSFWKKVALTDRAVPPPEPVGFGFLKDVSWSFSSLGQENSRTSTSS
ncbi:hypothetical protein DFH09DRAFT_1189670 [Mycena vulgaris]|nr:hypothetical protein DFH09DRAFT_1189670 [Mycena vulgaris]